MLRAEMGTCPCTFAADAFASGWAGTSSFDLPYV